MISIAVKINNILKQLLKVLKSNKQKMNNESGTSLVVVSTKAAHAFDYNENKIKRVKVETKEQNFEWLYLTDRDTNE